MSCGIALTVALMFSDPTVALAAAQPPAVAGAPVSVADEPLFKDIVLRSGALKQLVDQWRANAAATPEWTATPEALARLEVEMKALADLDMQGHLVLKARNTDGDLKCILRGIAEDIPLKMTALETAGTASARTQALSDLSYLLNDNVEVITAPPQPAA